MRAPLTDLPVVLADVSVRVGPVTILDRVSLRIASGRPTVLVGPNGSGKSTLLRSVMRLLEPSSGRISWGGRGDGGQRCAMVFQRPVMLRRSAAANVGYALGRGGRGGATRTADLLRQVGLSAVADRPARRLSGGEQQRLALARALARDPEVLLLDEPSASLDPASTKAVEDIIRAVEASGVKIVMATHDLGQARRLGGDVVLLVNGRIVEQAAADRFFVAPAAPETAAFLRGDIVI